ncbi:Hint domain-containing protein [Asaia astilbis]
MANNQKRSGATVTGGATNYVGKGKVTSGDLVYGLNGGTNRPSVNLASGGVISGATVLSGGVAAAAANGTVYGGTAYESGSIAALNQGTVISSTIASGAGLAVGNLSGYKGTPAQAIAPHVMAGGHAIVGGGFTIKGQTFAGSGVVSGGTFDVGSTEQLASGGTDSGSLFGGTQIVSGGGTALKDIFSGGVQLVKGGLASETVVSSGGTVVAMSGGRVSSVRVGEGGTAVAGPGGVIINPLVLARAVSIVSSDGTVSGATIASGGSEKVQSGGVVSGATIQSGGEQSVESGGTVSRALVSAGGSMLVDSGATVSNLTIGGASNSTDPAGLVVVSPGAVLSNVSVGWRGRVEIKGLAYQPGSKITVNRGVLRVAYPDGSSWSTPLAGSYKAADFHVEADSDGSTDLVYDNCFLAGTMIRTLEGERPVESLRVGDAVLVSSDQGLTIRLVTWVGSGDVLVDASRPDDEAGHPVRFRAGAIEPSVPDRDLYITAEHNVFLRGALVPARMLVNGDSIAYDRTRSQYKVYHFRTGDHAIIWSNNMATETFLDDGNLSGLVPDADSAAVVAASEPQALAAPLNVTREFVEPLFYDLARVGETLAESAPKPQRRQDSDMHLTSADGRVIRPTRQMDDMVVFHVPTEIEEVWIRSNSARPSDTEGPFVDDRRDLGVLIGDILLWDTDHTSRLDAHLKDEVLEGWYGLESEPMRWTNGNARLVLGSRKVGAPGVLGIHVKARALYEPVVTG